MSALLDEADSPPVDAPELERGRAIKHRRLVAGIKSLREFAKATGVARNAITAAEDGHGSKGTYERLEAWLDAFDEETGGDDIPAPEVDRQIEVTVSGNFGVTTTVRGSARDIDALEALAGRLIERMSSPTTTTAGTPEERITESVGAVLRADHERETRRSGGAGAENPAAPVTER